MWPSVGYLIVSLSLNLHIYDEDTNFAGLLGLETRNLKPGPVADSAVVRQALIPQPYS